MRTISIVIPVKDEQDTIGTLICAIGDLFNSTLLGSAILNELIVVDDGSLDNTWSETVKAAEARPFLRGVRLRRNFGKAAALQEGIRYATGQVVVTMDGDLQDDPKELPRFLAAIDAGADVVSGWKKVRHDPPGKTIPSKLFNRVTSAVTGVRIHDFNCGFKAYKKDVLEKIVLYGELHRFIPAIAHSIGFRVGEIVVEHHPRKFGRSKYGLGRLLKGFIDLLTVVTITRFNWRPAHLFGGLGVLLGAMGGSALLYLTVLWFLGHPIGDRPLLLVSVLLIIVALQFVLFGMLAELIVGLRGPLGAGTNIVAEVIGGVPPPEKSATASR